MLQAGVHLPDAASQFCELGSDSMIGTSASATVLLHGEQLLLQGVILLAEGISFSFPCTGCPLSPFGLIHAVLQSLLFKSVRETLVPKPFELMVSRGVGRMPKHDGSVGLQVNSSNVCHQSQHQGSTPSV